MGPTAAANPRIRPVERATGRPWAQWLQFMDSIDAKNLDHHQIALKVYEELDGTIERLGWWTQAVTVAYEQDIGRRVPGQRPDGTFQTSVSRSTTLGMQELMRRWTRFAATDDTMRNLVLATCASVVPIGASRGEPGPTMAPPSSSPASRRRTGPPRSWRPRSACSPRSPTTEPESTGRPPSSASSAPCPLPETPFPDRSLRGQLVPCGFTTALACGSLVTPRAA